MEKYSWHKLHLTRSFFPMTARCLVLQLGNTVVEFLDWILMFIGHGCCAFVAVKRWVSLLSITTWVLKGLVG